MRKENYFMGQLHAVSWAERFSTAKDILECVECPVAPSNYIYLRIHSLYYNTWTG